MDVAQLPKDVLVSIFRECKEQHTLRALSLVCKRFAQVIAADVDLVRVMRLAIFCDGAATTAAGPGFHVLNVKLAARGHSVAHVKFSNTGISDQPHELSEYTSIALTEQGREVPHMFRLAFFADGDAWALGGHANYPKGYGEGSQPFAFGAGETISICVASGGDLTRKGCILQDQHPNCKVSFFRDGKLAHQPFLLNVKNVAAMCIGVYLPPDTGAESVAAPAGSYASMVDGDRGSKCAVQ